MIEPAVTRRLPVGAEVLPHGAVHFRVYAPQRRSVEVLFESAHAALRAAALEREPSGHWSVELPDGAEWMRYRFRVDGREIYPDPASRFQPDGPHGPSEVVDAASFRWTDDRWRGIVLPGQVLYELHVGTFTPEGTWAAAAARLRPLADLGVTTVEVMPVAEFPGRFGWGYDGAALFAPFHRYGRPDDFRAFVDRAHRLGLGVILDVVYNHLGPDGCYVPVFYPHIFSRRRSDWGDAINCDGEGSSAVRELVLANAAYWIAEFHLDGLRLDATHAITDSSPRSILEEIGRAARAAAADRRILVIAESETQDAVLVRPAEGGGYGLDAVWNDDWHHSAFVALTGRREAYYAGYRGTPQEFVSSAKYGYLYPRQREEQRAAGGRPPVRGLPPAVFVAYLENHDQVSNVGFGLRLHQQSDPAALRAMTALLLLGPWTPLLFQGQEYAVHSPFPYFADHTPELMAKVREGRMDFLCRFPSAAAIRDRLPDPGREETFRRAVLDPGELDPSRPAYRLHQDLLRLRRSDPVLAAQGAYGLDGAVLGDRSFLLRLFAPDGADRLIAVNLGPATDLGEAAEPLLAPPPGRRWQVLWSSEDVRYGAQGTPRIESEEGLRRLPACAALLLGP